MSEPTQPARARTFDDAPPVCPRCHGPWRRVAEGYSCLLCSRLFVIDQAIAQSSRRRLFEIERPLEPIKRGPKPGKRRPR